MILNCNTPGSTTLATDSLLKKGDKTLVCVHFLPQGVKIGFQLVVDHFVAVSARRAFETMAAKDTDIAIQLANSEYVSNQIPYIRPSVNQVFPVISLRIVLDKGEIVSIEHESIADACKEPVTPEIIDQGNDFASKNEVASCPTQLCQDADNEKGKCDFKIFVSWAGTDIKGKGLVSSSKRISRFAGFNFDGMLKSILDMDMNVVPGSPDPLDLNSISSEVQERINDTQL